MGGGGLMVKWWRGAVEELAKGNVFRIGRKGRIEWRWSRRRQR